MLLLSFMNDSASIIQRLFKLLYLFKTQWLIKINKNNVIRPVSYGLHPRSYALRPTSYTLRPMSYALLSMPYVLRPTFYALHPKPYVLHHTSFTICHMSCTILNTSYVLYPLSYTILGESGLLKKNLKLCFSLKSKAETEIYHV